MSKGTSSESAHRHANLNVNMCFPSAFARLGPPLQFAVVRRAFHFAIGFPSRRSLRCRYRLHQTTFIPKADAA